MVLNYRVDFKETVLICGLDSFYSGYDLVQSK